LKSYDDISNIFLPHPNPPLVKATVYTQVIELPHPSPPLVKGREQDLFFSLNKADKNAIKITVNHFSNNLLDTLLTIIAFKTSS
jgi:hypothetical protein